VGFDTVDVVSRFLTALQERDKDKLAAVLHVDFVTEIRQSGEKTAGLEAFWAELESYPGGGPLVPALPEVTVVSDDERWLMTPGYTVIPLASRNEFTVKFRIRYPDGRWWHVVGIAEVRDNKLYRLENYFAPEMPAPLAESISAYGRG
jgi:hypothetical protein